MHQKLIKSLGGTGAVAAKLGLPLSQVSNWRRRGVSWPWRAAVNSWALTEGVTVPAGFLRPPRERKNGR